jgi:voltage-gated potassium channel
MVSFMAVVDLAAILPFYLSMFTALDTRFLRVLRLLRVFKLTRHFRSLEVLIQVIRQEGPVLASAMFILMVLIVLAAGGMYVVEHDVQPEAFGSIPHAMWWAAVTLTTVGYGDTIPITVAGKMFAVAITILGVGMAAMPAGIIASGFTRELQKRRDMFQNSVREALEDGFITPEEQKHLEDMRKRLGLDPEDAQAVTRAEFALMCELESSHCPHCGKKLSGS